MDIHTPQKEKEGKRVFSDAQKLCASCPEMVVEGPWEPVYAIVKAKMPPVRSMGQIAELGKDFVKL